MTKAAATGRSGLRHARMALLAAMIFVVCESRAAGNPRLFDIPAQSLESALEALALASDYQILFWTQDLHGLRGRRLQGSFSVERALEFLLAESGLKFDITGNTIVILPPEPLSAPPAVVHADPPPPPEPESLPVVIEEVIVTARRREEDLQEVPISVTAMEATALEQRNVGNVLEANGQAANVAINSDPFSGVAGSQMRMRGIPGVVLYQDGVRTVSGALPSTIDVERVEVLRGPQGTLFGRNAIGGAIQTITRRPEDRFSTRINVTTGSAERLDVSGTVNIPLLDNLFTRLTASSLTRDGFVSSPYLDTLLGSQKDRLVRFDLLWRPGDAVEGRLQVTRTRNHSSGQANVNFRLDAVCPGDPVPAGYRNGSGEQLFFAPNAYCILSRLDLDPATPGVQPYSTEFHSLGAREEYRNTVRYQDSGWWQDIDDVKLDLRGAINDRWQLRLIASRRFGSAYSTEDLDATGLNLFQNDLNDIEQRFDTRTAELQLLYGTPRLYGTSGIYWEEAPGAFEKRISWVHNELTMPAIAAAAEAAYPGSTDFLVRPESAPFNTAEVFRIQKTSTRQRAAFAEWTWAATDALKLTGGLRYTSQVGRQVRYAPGAQGAVNMPPVLCCELDPGIDYIEPRGPAMIASLPRFEQWTPRVSAQYQWRPYFMAYLSYAKGASAGGINTDPPRGAAPFPYLPQKVRNYEAGLRADLLDRRLRVNATVFYNDFVDVQVSEEIFPGSMVTGNAQAQILGFEIEGAWLATDRLRFDYAFGHVDAQYTDTGTTTNIQRGTSFPYAPEFTAALGAQYRWNLGGGRLTLRGDYTWQDTTVTAADPLTAGVVPSQGLLGARLSYVPDRGRWNVALSGTNLTDLYYFTSGFLLPADQSFSGTLGRPREWALSFNLEFE